MMPAPPAAAASQNRNTNTLLPPRRATTLPTRLQSDAAATDDADTLFAHPHTTIVAFNSSIAGPTQTGWGTSKLVDSVPWTTRTERVVAAGPLRLYRLKNSDHVCFLHSGQLLLSLLPRSQVWCVDGVSKFAIRIQPYIYRIELPAETDQDKSLLGDFTAVLGKVLYYERTPCPFKRGFAQEDAEDLPSPAARKLLRDSSRARKWELKKYWRPEGDEAYVPYRPSSNSSAESVDDHSISDADSNNAAKSINTQEAEQGFSAPIHRKQPPTVTSLRDRFDIAEPVRSVTNPVFVPPAQTTRDGSPRGHLHVDASSSRAGGGGFSLSPRAGKVSDMTAHFSAVTIDSPGSLPSVDPDSPKTPVTATERITVAKRVPVLVPETEPLEDGKVETVPSELEEMQDDCVDATDDLIAQTPEVLADFSPESDSALTSNHEKIEVHEPETSGPEPDQLDRSEPQPDTLITPENPPKLQDISTTTLERPVTPPNPDPSFTESQREASPADPTTPTATRISTPSTPSTSKRRTASPRSAQRFRSNELPDYLKDEHLIRPGTSSGVALALSPTALVQKTCALLLGPPSGLVQIMVQIAARLRQASASGAFRVPKSLRPSRALPGRFADSDEEDDDDEYSPWKEVQVEDDEDDFGVSLGIETPARERRRGFGLGELNAAELVEEEEEEQEDE